MTPVESSLKAQRGTRSERGGITTNLTEIKKGYYAQRYTNILDNLDEMDKFLERGKLPKLPQVGTEI